MFKEVVSEQTRHNLELLTGEGRLQKFYLAGGTAAALQIGHRVSEDLDFFSEAEFSVEGLITALKVLGDLIIDKKLEDTLLGNLNGTKVSFFYYPYPLIGEFGNYLGVRLASLTDIACMKIDTIASRGLKRDFIDLYYISQKTGQRLAEWLELFQRKYHGIRYNLNHIKKSLTYFENAENDPTPHMLKQDFSWRDVKQFFVEEIKHS